MTRQHLPPLPALTLPEMARPLSAHPTPPPSALARWQPGIRTAADPGNADISILDAIGEGWDGEGITAKRIAAALRQIGPAPVTVHINSPGGDFFEGVAIYNQLRAHPAPVSVHVLGLAASAASLIAMAGDAIHMGEGAFLMIHNAHALAVGNRHAMTAAARLLEPFDAAMANLYAARSGADVDTIAQWMDAETWLNADTAIACGLADAHLPAARIRHLPAARSERRALALVESALAHSGQSRAERRATLKSLFSHTPGTPRAADPPAEVPREEVPREEVPVTPRADLATLAAPLQSLIQQLKGSRP